MRSARSFARLFALFLALPLLLTACESTKGWDWFSSNDADLKASKTTEKTENVTVQTPAGCPPVEVPKAVASQSMGGTAPLDLQALLNIAVTSSACEEKDGMIRQTVSLKLDATKGPALKQDALDVPFFAAVTGTGGTVMAKKMYQTTFDFSGELTDTEELAIIFTLSRAQADTATIVAGLGIDPNDLQAAQ